MDQALHPSWTKPGQLVVLAEGGAGLSGPGDCLPPSSFPGFPPRIVPRQAPGTPSSCAGFPSVIRGGATGKEVSSGREDLLEEDMATHSSILAWRIPWTRGDWWATVHRVAKSGK